MKTKLKYIEEKYKNYRISRNIQKTIWIIFGEQPVNIEFTYLAMWNPSVALFISLLL